MSFGYMPMFTVDRNDEIFKLVSRTRQKRVFDKQIKTLNKFLFEIVLK
jgi:hypothetical protein